MSHFCPTMQNYPKDGTLNIGQLYARIPTNGALHHSSTQSLLVCMALLQGAREAHAQAIYCAGYIPIKLALKLCSIEVHEKNWEDHIKTLYSMLHFIQSRDLKLPAFGPPSAKVIAQSGSKLLESCEGVSVMVPKLLPFLPSTLLV